MGVASHLQIPLDEYDTRIRTFIPGYEEMLEAAATALHALAGRNPRVIDLGAGTGALAAACARLMPDLRLTLVDADAAILQMARTRLAGLANPPEVIPADFLEADLPGADAVVSSLALHHVRVAAEKAGFFRKLRQLMTPGGLFLLADCCPSGDHRLARAEHVMWREHLRATYSSEETTRFFNGWAEEDTYFPLPEECERLRRAGFAPDVVWRRGAFAVVAAVAA